MAWESMWVISGLNSNFTPQLWKTVIDWEPKYISIGSATSCKQQEKKSIESFDVFAQNHNS